MTATPGYKASFQLGPTTFTTVGEVTSVDVKIDTDVYDITALGGDGWRVKITGLSTYTLSLQAKFDLTDAKQQAIQAALITTPGSTLTWKIFPSGGTAPYYSGTCLVKSEDLSIAVDSEETVKWDLEGTGAIVFSLT